MVSANKLGNGEKPSKLKISKKKNKKIEDVFLGWISSKYINEECLWHSKSDSIEFMIYNNVDESLLLR